MIDSNRTDSMILHSALEKMDLRDKLEENQVIFVAWLNATIGKKRQEHLCQVLRDTPGAMIAGSALMQVVHPSNKEWGPEDIDVFFDATKTEYMSSEDIMMTFMRKMCMCGAHDSIHDYNEIGWAKGTPPKSTACFHYYQREEADIPRKYFRSADASCERSLRSFVSTGTGCWGDAIRMNLIAVSPIERFGTSPGFIDHGMRMFIQADFAPKECAATFNGYYIEAPAQVLRPNTVHMEPFREWPGIAGGASSITLNAYREAMAPYLKRKHLRHFLERIAKYVNRGYTVVLTGVSGGATIVP